MQVKGLVNGRSCPLTLDTGADQTFIRTDMLESDLPLAARRMCGVTGNCIPLWGPRDVQLKLDREEYHLPMYAADMEDSCLLGLDFLYENEACIDFSKKTLRVGNEEVPLIHSGATLMCRNIKSLDGGVPEHIRDLLHRSVKGLTNEQTGQLQELLCQYADVFSAGDHDLGCTGLVQHCINTGSNPPMKHTPRRVAPIRRKEMEKAVQELFDQGLIEKSDSPWSSAVVLVTKKDGSTRFCVDYRALNDVTVKDSYPLPRIDDTLDALVGAQWFSTLDLKSGYHQVEMAMEDRKKTAFSFGQGLWQFKVMPFGLCNAPATFERLMERILEGLQWKTALVYLDDVIVFGGSFEEELDRLEGVFQRLRQASLKLSPKKCELFRQEVPFLGHVVSRGGVKTDPQKVKAVQEWPVPRNLTEVRSFLGLCTYYRRFVKDFACIATPLHHLSKKGVRFCWDTACQEAFENLKEALTHSPVLPYPDPNQPYILDTDASAEGAGAVLSQVKDSCEYVVAYYSYKFNKAERNYCVTRKELLAIVKSLDHFHPYLYGARFKVRTDHSALQWLKTLKKPEGQLARWLGKLEQHDYSVEHRPGRVHNNADALSRRPCAPECKHCSGKDPVDMCKRTQVCDEDEETEDLGDAQSADLDIGPVVRWMEEGQNRPKWEEVALMSPATKSYWHDWEAFQLQDGILRRKWIQPDGRVKFWQLVIPKERRERLLQEVHDNFAGGHLGVRKTLSRLKQRFYWFGMRRDVKEWCRTCDTCNAKKGPNRKGKAPLQLYQVGSPMERVAIDIAGPFPTTESGNRFICVAMDYFSKWPEAYALPNHEATTVAQVLVDQFFARFGVPGELHSDQGREFEAKVFQECCQLLGLRKTRTTPLRPQSDGMVERFNRTLLQELSKYCSDGQTQWDCKLPLLLMAYRSAEHEATSHSPACVMLGREIRLPVDLVTGRPPDEELPTVTTDYAVTLQKRLEEVHHHVRSQLKFSGESMRRHYDRNSKAAKFQAGELVWLHNPKRKKGLSPKLQSAWEGPYTIVERVTEVTFRIRRGQGRPKIVHADRLWKYRGDPHYTWDQDEARKKVDPHCEEDDALEAAGLEDAMAWPDESLVVPNMENCGSEEAMDDDDVDGALAVPMPQRPRRRRMIPQRLQDYIIDI